MCIRLSAVLVSNEEAIHATIFRASLLPRGTELQRRTFINIDNIVFDMDVGARIEKV